MRILTVPPGPNFSVADVHTGWTAALGRLAPTRSDNFSERLMFTEQALRGKIPENERGHAAAHMAADGLLANVYRWAPDLVVITSAFFVPPDIYDLLRERGVKVAVLLTESPYEDPAQYNIAARADVAIVNDPTNLDTFRQHQPKTFYLPHSYDPDRHKRRRPVPEYQLDFGWVGTAFPSRIEFFESVNWWDHTVGLAGNWQQLPDDSPLRRFLLHDDGCFHNDTAVDLYSSVKASANIYRKEAVTDGFSQGWSMGPREVELAACGTFFLREPRPEGDELFPFLPTFDGPDDFSDQLTWWLSHDMERTEAARLAQQAVAEFTFNNRAKFLLEQLGF